MKYFEFATQNFVGLYSLQKYYARYEFTFRENKYSDIYVVKEFIKFIVELLKNVKKNKVY